MFKHKDQRVGVFIDTQNMYYSARNLFRRKVNFKRIVEDAVAERKLIRAIAYVVATESEHEKPFFEALEKAGIETNAKDLQEFKSGMKKADWDVGLAIDVVKMIPLLDVVVLVTGDGDFQPLVNYATSRGRVVEVMGFGQTTSTALRTMVKDFTDLSENKRRYLIGPKLKPYKGNLPRNVNLEKEKVGEVQDDDDGFFMKLDESVENQEENRSRRLEF